MQHETLRALIESGDYSRYPRRLDAGYLDAETITAALYGLAFAAHEQAEAFRAGTDLRIITIDAWNVRDNSVGIHVVLLDGVANAVLFRPDRDTQPDLSFLSPRSLKAFLRAWDRCRPATLSAASLVADRVLALPLRNRSEEGYLNIDPRGGLRDLRLNEAGCIAEFAALGGTAGVRACPDAGRLRFLFKSIEAILQENDLKCRELGEVEEKYRDRLTPDRLAAMVCEAQEAIWKRQSRASDIRDEMVLPLADRLAELDAPGATKRKAPRPFRISGAELLEFMREAWPGDEWHWETDFGTVDPKAEYESSAIRGFIWGGSGAPPAGRFGFPYLFRKWRKAKADRLFDAKRQSQLKGDLDGLLNNMNDGKAG